MAQDNSGDTILNSVGTGFKPVPTFNITKDSAIITYGKYTIKVGPIKNTASGWNSQGRFSWGSSPALLKLIEE